MKKTFVIFFIILTSCSKHTVPFEVGFTKISDKYQDRNKLIEQRSLLIAASRQFKLKIILQ